jgi:phage tail tape measure protein, TP901 family
LAGSSEQELAIRIAGKVENSLKQSLGMTEDGISHLAGMAKKAAVMITGAFAAIKVGQFIGDAVSEYSEFEQSMANTSGIAGATASEYEKLSKAARDAGKATTFTASEAADALGYMALAGWDVETSTKALTPVLKLAEATQADLATTSDQVTDSMSAMGVGIDELQEYLDVVVMTNNKANTTSADLMDAMIGCGGAARASGMDFKETATALGILANNGVKGAEAGTALNSMLVRISTKDAAKAAFEDLGVAVYDNAGKMRDMRQILIDLNGAMSGLTEEEKNNYMAAIAGTNYYSKFGYLLDGVKEGADGAASAWDALADNLNNSSGALDTMDARVTNTLKGAVARFGSAISDLKISMVEAFGPHAIKIMDGLSNTIPKITENFVGMINKLPIDDFMNGVGNMSAGVMDFLVTLTGGEGSIDAFSNMMSDTFGIELPESIRSAIEVAQDFIKRGQEVAGFLIGTLKNAIGNVMEKIAENEHTFDVILDLLSDLKWKFLEAFDNAKPTITYIAETAIPNITDALLKVVGGVTDVADAFVQWDGFLPTITAIGTAVAAIKFYKFVTGVYSAAKALTILNIAKAKDMALTLAIKAMYIQDAIVKAASVVQTYALVAAHAVWNVTATIGAGVTGALGAAFAFLISPIGLAIVAIGGIIAIGVLLWKNWDTVKEKAGQLGAWLGEKFNAIKESIGNAIEGFKNKFPVAFAFIEGVFNGWKATIDGVIGGVKQVFQGVIDFVQGVFTGNWSQALEGLKSIFSGAFGVLSSLALAPLNAMKGVVTGALSAINVATDGKLSEIKSFFTTHLEGAKNTVVGILDGIKNAFNEKLEAAKSIVSGAVNAIKGFFNFKWELPKLKMPHFSIKGDFSLAPPKVPTLGVEWYKDGGIMTSPTMFGINGNNAMVGGEAGAEAILPLSDLWNKMGGFIDSAIGESVKILAERIEDFQTGTNRVPLSTLSDRIASSGYTVAGASGDGGAVSINYAPVYKFEGSVSKDDIIQANEISQDKFDKLMRQWMKDKGRTSF